jgi:protein-tyrosine phosphatase
MNILDGRRLVDIHTHVLPRVDDGAKDEQAALEMLRVAAADGIGTVVATPHAHHARPERIGDEAARLTALARSEGIDICVLPGSEVRIAADLVEKFKAGKLVTLNGTRHMLLELSLAHEWRIDVVEKVILKLQEAGLRPILAHPERYPFVIIEPKLAATFVALDVPLQLNALSLSGYHSQAAQRTAYTLLDAGHVHIVASDAHSARWRPPQLRTALAEIAERRGARYVEGLLANADAVIAGEPVRLVLGSA